MAFGHWMEVKEGEVHLRLGPIRRDEVGRFVSRDAGHGLQSYEVARYLGFSLPPSEEGEQEWWDKASKDQDKIHWGIYVPVTGDEEPSWLLVGNTALFLHFGRRRAESGFLLFDRAYWRQRIASTAHLARTLYAFQELDLLAITSMAYVPNEGSNRALQGVGYVKTGTRYGDAVVGGRTIDAHEYLLPNPSEEAWRYFWRRPEDEIPEEFKLGRALTLKTLERAEAAVTFL